MKILVAVATRHGGTSEIARVIAAEFERLGIAAESRELDETTPAIDVSAYDAAVIGSGVYMGRWLEPARRFMDEQTTALRRMPVWLFSSGPLGDPAQPAGDPKDVTNFAELTGARGYRTFAGRLDPATLGFGERLTVKLVRALTGDFRDWKAITAWTREIAAALNADRSAAA